MTAPARPAVRLARLALRDFRNLARADLAVPADGLAIVGENGQGKSNLLEAIYYLQLLRSVRGARDVELVAAHGAHLREESAILSDRREGRSMLSYRTPGGWVALTKDILTEVLGAGRDVKVAGLPSAAAGILTLMGPGLIVLAEDDPSASSGQ